MSDGWLDLLARLPDAGPLEVGEVLWLSTQGVVLPDEPRTEPSPVEAPSSPPGEVGPAAGVDASLPSAGEGGASRAEVAPMAHASARPPRPAAFPLARLVDRALHRLSLRAPIGAYRVDVAASLAASARLGASVPVRVRAPEPVARLLVFADQALGLAPFRPAARAVVEAARRGRRFARAELTWVDLTAPDEVGGARPWRQASGGEPLVVLLIQDGRAPAVRGGGLARWLDELPPDAVRAWIHPWSREAWARTPVVRLAVGRPPPLGRALPLLPLSGPGLEALAPWVHGRGSGALSGLVLPRRGPPARALPPDQQVAAFDRQAHPLSRAAAGIAAGVPGRIDLDLLRVLGASLAGGRITPTHTAEAMTSGLFQRGGQGTSTVVAFRSPEARARAVRWLPRSDVPRILASVVTHVEGGRATDPDLCLPPLPLLLALRDGQPPPPGLELGPGVPGELRAWVEATGFRVHQAVAALWGPRVEPGESPLAAQVRRLLSVPPWWTTVDDLATTLGAPAEAVERAIPPDLRARVGRGEPSLRLVAGSLAGLREGAGARRVLELPGGVELPLRYVPGGTFWMGSPDGVGDPGEHPRHEVNLSLGYWLAETPLTQAQWSALGTSNPSRYKGAYRPVDSVTWHEADAWCRALSAALPGAAGARLPTEAEWERACRAGTDTRWCHGDHPEGLERHAWFDRNREGTARVGERAPNPWGLHDLHGNVWEWCSDTGFRIYEQTTTEPHYQVHRDGDRVIRGGSYWFGADGCRSAYRARGTPEHRDLDQGFRPLVPGAAPPPIGR